MFKLLMLNISLCKINVICGYKKCKNFLVLFLIKDVRIIITKYIVAKM